MKSSDLNLELYRQLCVIRMAENGIIENYRGDEMKTPMHMSMGGEAVVSGVCHALGVDSQVFGTYRSHALYLAKTDDLKGFFAELYGKKFGRSKGKAGSMHLCYPEKGHMGSSAVVGTINSVASGCAFANQYLGKDRVTAAFFGDGAVDSGAFWESLNWACLKRLPVLFVCERNNWAVHTHNDARRGFKSLDNIVSQFECVAMQSSSTDVEEIYNVATACISKMKSLQRPGFLHLEYYRYLEHVGISEDFDAGYRSKEEFEKWKGKDPLDVQREKMLGLGDLVSAYDIESQVLKRVCDAIEFAKAEPFADDTEVYQGVFCA